ncbi:enolase-phosphatase E1-like [Penaeus japonicus]|uniref:enolase-phosphatase E1-like n=1 Tax=Penaeus japonicus TaxID=27405 RepID=UPI001C70FC8C|nr:enolase-phosphatase E1-like [Penaeus japonicus]
MKRLQEDLASIIEGVDVIMLDIEGTTTSISFVKDELFPYVRREVRNHLEATWEEEETKADVAALTCQVRKDLAAGVNGCHALPGDGGGREPLLDALVANVFAMMDADRKVAALKTLQGHMWRRAYHTGVVQGHVYEDVVPALKAWKAAGKKLIIYSSGSVAAQKLLFAHSVHGDILHLFDGHYDTAVGPKVESESYTAILRRLRCDPASLLFVTDLAKEAWAARAAGVHVVLSVREGTAPLSAEDRATFPTISSFAQFLQAPAKKARAGPKDETQPGEEADREEEDEDEGEEEEDGDDEGEEEEEQDESEGEENDKD